MDEINCGIRLKPRKKKIVGNKQDNKCNKGNDNRPWETQKESNQR